MKKFRPHHSIIFEKIFTYNGLMIAIPELCISKDLECNIDLKNIQTTDNKPMEGNSEFIIKNIDFFSWLETTRYLSFTIYATDEYFIDLPVMFGDEWSSNIDDYLLHDLGYSINKFTEPAVFYGVFPIEIYLSEDEMTIEKVNINDTSVLNKWGLINKLSDAQELAFENSKLDPDSEEWRVLLIKVDIYTYKKLLELR